MQDVFTVVLVNMPTLTSQTGKVMTNDTQECFYHVPEGTIMVSKVISTAAKCGWQGLT